jgi:hypothetical protein
LASNEEFAGLPIQVIQRHGHDFSCSQAETSQQEQDGIIALAGGMVLVTAL